MGTFHLLQLPPLVTAPSSSSLPQLTNPQNPSSRNPNRRRSAVYGRRGGGSPHWESDAERAIRNERSRFNGEYEFVTDDFDDFDEGFGFRGASNKKKRVWWSDHDSVDFEDDELGFGVLEESIDIDWIFKIFRAFGWMLPAVIISMLLGTELNDFFMAFALPIAQSALSLATDTLWGRSSNYHPRPKPKTKKKKPFARASSKIEMDERENEENMNSRKGRESYYQSWTASNDASAKKGEKGTPKFGGWDELDMGENAGKVPKAGPTRKENTRRGQKKRKIGRRARGRDTPVLLRLLISVFPILGSWTRFL